MKLIILLLAIIGIFASSNAPKAKDIPLVENFELDKYLGTWYEIARLDHSFERNLDSVTATYSVRDDGKIKVLNKGYNTKKGKWSTAEGKAWIPNEDQPARLKVSFFWIFSAEYRIIALDDEYSYAMVTSSSKKYLWILSRSPKMPEEKLDMLLKKAKDWGFDLSEIYFVKH
ncbi:MAG: lipocalin family protein [Candidatus Zixiibacteriota bacterium]